MEELHSAVEGIQNNRQVLTFPLWARIEKNRINRHPIIQVPKIKGVSKVSE